MSPPRRLFPVPGRRLARRVHVGAAALGLLLVLPGCALWPSGKNKARPAPPRPGACTAPAHQSLGRILSHDAKAGVALVDLSPFATLPSDLAGRALIARDSATLAPTARLVASARRSGTVLGVYVVEGTPRPDNEVALSPAP